tara:strand:+ start:117944 stop:118084 length:141 start_codon:yes stop_codon:yes gene_type:complete
MSIQDEIHQALREIESTLIKNIDLNDHRSKVLLLAALIEEEGQLND